MELVHTVEKRLLEERVALPVLLTSPPLLLGFIASDCLFGVVGLSVADDILERFEHPGARVVEANDVDTVNLIIAEVLEIDLKFQFLLNCLFHLEIGVFVAERYFALPVLSSIEQQQKYEEGDGQDDCTGFYVICWAVLIGGAKS